MCYIAAVIKYWTLSETETAPQVPSDQKADISLSKPHPLLRYAFSHGFRRIQCLESVNGVVINGMITLRLDIKRHPVEWHHMCKLTTLSLPYPPISLAAQHDFILCVIISSLPEPFLRAFLRRAPFKALDGTNPLIYAAYFDKIDHARTLLSCGVSHVNRTGLEVERPCQALPLEVAFHYRNHSLFDLFLLHWGATVPPRLFSSVFHDHYLTYNPRDATMLLQCDEFAEWVADGQCGQSLLHALDRDWYTIMWSASEKTVLTVLQRLTQVGCDFSNPDSLESVLPIIFTAASQGSLAVMLCLYSLDVPIPSRMLFIGGTTFIQELILRGLDVNAIVAHGDRTLHRAFGGCKRGSSCWAPDCNLCSIFLRIIVPQLEVSQSF